MSYLGTLSPSSSSVDSSDLKYNSPMSNVTMSPSMIYNSNIMIVDDLELPGEFNPNAPYLEILVQPAEKFRFRYKSEMVGTHGSLTGANSDKMRKSTYPTVKLHNFNGRGLIRCSLVQNKSEEPHAHRLVIKAGHGERDDPHDIEISPERGYTAIFSGMGIIHTAKKYLKSEIAKKKMRIYAEDLSRSRNSRKLTKIEEAEIDRLAEIESKSINLNTVRLKFEAFTFEEDNVLRTLCHPIYSHGINNLKSALTGELKIVRMDHTCTSCVGGQEIFILVEKVTKNNIRVRFFECDEDDNEIWIDYGKFSPIDVHHQYAIVFKAPAYKRQDIQETVEVCIQLERPSDGARSEPRIFKYKPTDKIGRKRSRYSESLSSTELPATINNISIGSSASLPDSLIPKDPTFFDRLENYKSDDFNNLFETISTEYSNTCTIDGPATDFGSSIKLIDPESEKIAKRVVGALQSRLKENPPAEEVERLVTNLFNDFTTSKGNK